MKLLSVAATCANVGGRPRPRASHDAQMERNTNHGSFLSLLGKETAAVCLRFDIMKHLWSSSCLIIEGSLNDTLSHCFELKEENKSLDFENAHCPQHAVPETDEHICVFPQCWNLLTNKKFTSFSRSKGRNLSDNPTKFGDLPKTNVGLFYSNHNY